MALTCAQCIPNLILPGDKVANCSPKLSGFAERIWTVPEPPVEAYVSDVGCKETDHARKWGVCQV